MTVNDWIGLPYRDRGRDFTGLDCWGLCYLFQRHVMGNEVPSYVTEYAGAEASDSVADAITRNVGNWVKVDGEPRYGDVLIFNVKRLPIHTAVYIGNGDFLHAMKGTASCVERLASITWQKRLAAVIRWKNKNI